MQVFTMDYKLTKQGVRDLSKLSPNRLSRKIEIPPNHVEPQYFKLFVSRDLGTHYNWISIGTEEKLSPLMKKCDEQGLRWYVEDVDDGKISHISKIHSQSLRILWRNS